VALSGIVGSDEQPALPLFADMCRVSTSPIIRAAVESLDRDVLDSRITLRRNIEEAPL